MYTLPKMCWVHLAKLVTIAILLKATTGFFMHHSQCLVPSPCTCTQSSLVCLAASLTNVPTLTIFNPQAQDTFYIILKNNTLTSLLRNAFINISLVHPTSVDIDLSDNNIAAIDPEAFKGVENTTSLDLDANKLTSLPTALVKLENLQTLVLTENPLSHIDPVVMAHIGRSLTHFLFDMKAITIWPRSINKLEMLEQLQLSNLQLRYIPMDAFIGQSHMLRHLTITNSTLARMPIAVCHLHSLESLHIVFISPFDSDNALNEPCSPPLQNMSWLEVDGGNLRNFPELLLHYPALTILKIRNHDIHTIRSNVFPGSNKLQSLDLSNNSLPRIPFALSKLTNLKRLDLTNNQITTIEEYDLIGLSSLTKLKLSHNPIEYIAPDAFKNNSLITALYLENTRLHLVPKSVSTLPRLTMFYFVGNDAECNCRLSYLKGWKVLGVSYFQGDCFNRRHESIANYISTYLPNCPQLIQP